MPPACRLPELAWHTSKETNASEVEQETKEMNIEHTKSCQNKIAAMYDPELL